MTYGSTDKAGNSELANSMTVKVDSTKPSVWLTARNGSMTAYNKPVFDFGATDVNGIASSAVRLARFDEETQQWSAPELITATSGKPLLSALTDGKYRLVFTAQDTAGNVAEASCDFTVDLPDSPFSFAPGTPSEGNTVLLCADATPARDGSWQTMTWQWRVTSPDVDPLTFDGPAYYLTLGTAGDFQVHLTVTDVGTGAESVSSQTIHANGQAPFTHALNVEVLDGTPAKLVGRFLDPGWRQSHEAEWAIDGVPDRVETTMTEDNRAAMDSGYAEGTSAPLRLSHGQYTGHLTVSDGTGQSTDSDFTVAPVAANPNRDESNNTFVDATPIKSNSVHLSYIQSAGDIDVFEVTVKPTSDNLQGLLPYGTEVLATLRDMPADYDLAVVQDYASAPDPNSVEAAEKASGSARSWQDSLKLKPGIDLSQEILKLKPGIDLWQETLKLKPGIDPGQEILKLKPGIDLWLETLKLKPGIDLSQEIFKLKPGIDLWQEILKLKPGIGFDRDPFLSMAFALSASPDSLDGWSFNDMTSTGLANTTASGTDIDFAELGFDNKVMEDKEVAGYSAHSGTEPEVVLANTNSVGGKTYLMVIGHNQAFSTSAPYALQVETSVPLDLLRKVNESAQALPPVVDSVNETSAPCNPDPSPPSQPEPLTLFVTQAQRIDALYGDAQEPHPFEHIVLPALHAACASDLVRGEVLSVPSSIYDGRAAGGTAGWDENPWDTTMANAVTETIRTEIQQELEQHPSIKYVVLVGSDDVIPQRRVQDGTVCGNERAYASDSWLKSSSPLLAAMYDSKILTDDYYVDSSGIPFNNDYLYVPTRAISRLVETPSEIALEIQRFLDSGGRLAGGSSVVTGQDFITDCAERVSTLLQAAKITPVLESISDWKVADLKRDLLDAGRDVASINAHCDHYRVISAHGSHNFSTPGFDWTAEILYGTTIADAPDFLGKLVFTVGCHAGLNVPDRQVAVPADYVGQEDPRLDIAQAMARQQGVLVANTGYGFGDYETIAGSETMMVNLADQATTADGATVQEDDATPAREETGQPLGVALAKAKAQYYCSAASLDPYDVKSIMQTTLYGMPQYRLECTTHEAPQPVQSSGLRSMAKVPLDGGAAGVGGAGVPLIDPASGTQATLQLTVVDGGQRTTYDAVPLYEEVTADGSHIIKAAVPNTTILDSESTPDRPTQPKVVAILQADTNPVKSAIVTEGTYFKLPDFNPQMAVWTEGEHSFAEALESADGWWPEPQVKVRTVESVDGVDQTLIVLPGQFKSDSAAGAAVIGTERVWTTMTVELTRGSPADYVRPTVNSVNLTYQGTHWTATVDAEDDKSGIASMVVAQVGVPDTTSKTFEQPIPVDANVYSLDLSDLLSGVTASDVEITVAVTDGAGNTTVKTGKGMFITGPPTGTAKLNSGAEATYSRTVSLDSDVLHATEVRTRVDDDAWSDWQPYASSVPVILTGATGTKTVSARYRNDSNPQVLPVSDSIDFEQIRITSPADGATTTDNTPTLQFAVTSAQTVVVKLDDATVNVASGQDSGLWLVARTR